MRKRLAQVLVGIATVAGVTIALTGVASANVPAIFIGGSPIGAVGDCIGVILDHDGRYNKMDAFGNGYDALLCAPSDTRQLGWGHAGGYYVNSTKGQVCVREDVWNGSSWVTKRLACTSGSGSADRALSSTAFYRLVRTK